LALALAERPARAEEEGRPVRSGLDYVHASVAVGAALSSFQARYDLDVSRSPGDWDHLLFEGDRSGAGGLLSAGLGFRLIPQLTAGVQVELARSRAPLGHALLEETGAHFAPTLDQIFTALFADARGRGPWHGGLAIGYLLLREGIRSPTRTNYDHSMFGAQLFGGYLVALGPELAFDTTLRATLAFEGFPGSHGGTIGRSSDLTALAACVGLRLR
jgi:hypothetical protein